MRTICRVPLQALSLRLSILYLRTCVGLGYGNKYLISKCLLFSWSNFSKTSFFKEKDFLGKTHQSRHWSCTLEAVLTLRGLTLLNNPFVFGEMYYNIFTLLMSALSLQLRPNNETLFIVRSECSTTYLKFI